MRCTVSLDTLSLADRHVPPIAAGSLRDAAVAAPARDARARTPLLCRWSVVLAALLALMGAALTPTPALADIKVWIGAGADNNWMTPGNWTPAVPVAGDVLVFPDGVSQLTNN